MSNNNKLYRNFIILQEDERGYANATDKTLSGYSKIEARGDRCKISFYAQNLRKDNEKYYIMLICCKKDMKQLVNLGPLEVSDSGKGEITKEYDINNIGGVNLSYDKISGATICKIKDGIPIYVMYGFLNGEQPPDSWKSYKTMMGTDVKTKHMDKVIKSIDKKDDKKSEKKSEKKDEKKDYKKLEKAKCEKREEVQEIISGPEEVKVEIKQQVESNINKLDVEEVRISEEKTNELKADEVKINKVVENPIEDRDEQQYTLNNVYEVRENLRGKFEEYESKIELSKKDYQDDFKIRGSIGEYFETIAQGFEPYRKGYKDIKYCKWYKIPINDLYEMSNVSNYNKYTLAYYPMLNYYPYIKKYGYFMLGYKCDSEGNLKYIVYGIPGKKDRDEQPYDGRTGFVTWINDDDDRSEVGCWLMFYDFKNSTVVVPMQ